MNDAPPRQKLADKEPEPASSGGCERRHPPRAGGDGFPDLPEMWRLRVGLYGDDAYANVMVNVLDDREQFPQPNPVDLDDREQFPQPNPVDLDGENEAGKRQRRRDNWTPAGL